MPVSAPSNFSYHARLPIAGQMGLQRRGPHPLFVPRLLSYTLALLLAAPGVSVAFELGDASVESGLGQLLHVEVPYRLAANERLAADCISLTRLPNRTSVLPTYTQASRVIVGTTHIQVFSNQRVVEPLIELNVRVECDTVPHIVRNYQLFVDPPVRVAAVVANSRVGARTTPPATRVGDGRLSRNQATAPSTETSRQNTSPRARGETGSTLMQGQRYVVVRGDTLSGIASRVADRPSVWQTADAIFAANPQAFQNGNLDRISEGASIMIPLLTRTPAEATPVVQASSTPPPLEESAPAVDIAQAEPDVAASLPPNAQPLIETPATSIETTDSTSTQITDSPFLDETIPDPTPTVAPITAEPEVREPVAAAAAPLPRWLIAALGTGAVLVLLLASLLLMRRPSGRPVVSASRKSARASKATFIDERDAYTVEYQPTPDTGITLPPAEAGVYIGDDADDTQTVSMPADGGGDAADPSGELPVVATDHVDLDVGMPEDMGVAAGWLADEETGTLPSMPIDDEKHTVTIVELDLLRQDYEEEFTRTQVLGQELAVADLEAATAAHAAETATSEMPRYPQFEGPNSPVDSDAAPPRAKRKK